MNRRQGIGYSGNVETGEYGVPWHLVISRHLAQHATHTAFPDSGCTDGCEAEASIFPHLARLDQFAYPDPLVDTPHAHSE
jgi:hypothetical protein